MQPPEYPQHSLWSETKALQRNDTVFNLVELELGETRDLKELRIFPLQPDGPPASLPFPSNKERVRPFSQNLLADCFSDKSKTPSLFS